jgi:hypothetical protein
MTEDPEKILGIEPKSPAASGLSCPKCSKLDVAQPFGCGAFVFSIVAFFVVGGIIQAVRSAGTPGFQLENLLDFASVCVVVSVIWILLSALFGKNRCKACGHRWKRKRWGDAPPPDTGGADRKA